MFHLLRDPQLQFKFEIYKLNKNIEDIIKYNIKKKNKDTEFDTLIKIFFTSSI